MPLDYQKLAGIPSNEEEGPNSAMAESQTSYSFLENTASVYMVQGNLKEFMKRKDEHEKIIYKQQ